MKSIFSRVVFGAFLWFAISSLQAQTFYEKELALPFAKGAIHGVLTEVDSSKRQTVVLLIAGSGPTDRDGNSFILAGKNNSLKYLAEDLTTTSTAVFRYDKPGIGQSQVGIPMDKMVFQDMVDGANTCVNHLKSIGFQQVIIAGHSEGSLIGMLALQQADADAFISLLGPCQAAGDILKDQLQSLPQAVYDRAVLKIDSLSRGHKVEDDISSLSSLFNLQVQPYLISWMRHSPCETLAKISKPTLIIQGTADLQVPVEEGRCLNDCQPNAVYHELKFMNHVMKMVANAEENKDAYANPAYDLHPSLLPVITSFINTLER
ncbi:MAG: alpha/beta hydrolase [Schleiferiaceae bacterium]|nr:alpha/beta hydrolase [Schleiferiaceae bacterium]